MTIVVFDSLPSTNTYLKEHYEEYDNDTVIVAKRQTEGRGRFTRVWESHNDLTFSLLFKNNEHNHGLIAPLAIIKALESFGIDTFIKWPNDIYHDGKKLSGILIETVFQEKFKCIIVGIGINLSKKDDSLNATYIDYIEKDKILKEIIDYYHLLMKEPVDKLLEEYKNKSLLLNKYIYYKDTKYKIIDFTKDLEIIGESNNKTININANEIDIKSAIVK